MPSHSKTILVLSQVYVPDPASVGQHMHDAATELAARGYRVLVYTSNRGYEDPERRYARRELIGDVEIRRLPWTSFGKSSILLRVLAGFSFVIQCVLRPVWTNSLSGILISTSPPLCPLAGLALGSLRRVPICFWIMDLNPDQMIALGKAKKGSLSVRLFDCLNRLILRRADAVITLDRFMSERVNAKLDVREKLFVMPPWPHESHLESLPHAENPFRRRYGLDGKFVFMYSGNHSLSSPLDTVLKATLQLKDDPRIMFLFVGDGNAKIQVDDLIRQHRPCNILSLPYQPLDQIKYSLSAADVHLVAVGDQVVGIVHPCKIYGALAIGRPVLVLGPRECHAADILKENSVGWQIQHGDVEAAARTMRAIAQEEKDVLEEMGASAQATVKRQFSKARLLSGFTHVVESAFSGLTDPRANSEGLAEDERPERRAA